MTTAIRVELLIIDHEGLGEDEVRAILECQRFLHLHVKSIASVDLGEWDDGHPLNRRETCDAEYRRLFGSVAIPGGA